MNNRLFDITSGDGPPRFRDLTQGIVEATSHGSAVLFVTRARSALSVIEQHHGSIGRTRYSRASWLPNDGMFQPIPEPFAATTCGWWSRATFWYRSTHAAYVQVVEDWSALTLERQSTSCVAAIERVDRWRTHVLRADPTGALARDAGVGHPADSCGAPLCLNTAA